MRLCKHLRIQWLISALIVVSCSICLRAQTSPSAAGTAQPAVERDGQRDFDFELGTWTIHLKAPCAPLDGLKQLG
jgi:hypothetical protein